SNPTVPFSRPDTESFDSAMGRLDHSFSQTDKLTGRYEFDRFIKAAVFNPLLLISYSDATFAITAQNFLAHETHLFSPGLVNDFFNQPGIFGFAAQDNYLFGGASFATYQLFLGGILSDGAGVGNGFALQQGAGEFKNNRANFVGIYAQDNYRVTRRLTLNLGLRYEPAFPWSDTGNRWAQVNLAAVAAGTRSRVYPNAPPGVFFSSQNGIPSDGGMPKNALYTNWKGFAPRLGFAYDVFGNGNTSVRGGAGIFYDTRVMGMLSNRFVDEWPFSPQFILSMAGSSEPTAASAPGSLSDPICTNPGTQTALNCSGAQAAN